MTWQVMIGIETKFAEKYATFSAWNNCFSKSGLGVSTRSKLYNIGRSSQDKDYIYTYTRLRMLFCNISQSTRFVVSTDHTRSIWNRSPFSGTDVFGFADKLCPICAQKYMIDREVGGGGGGGGSSNDSTG